MIGCDDDDGVVERAAGLQFAEETIQLVVDTESASEETPV
jgi:hypothetical protein